MTGIAERLEHDFHPACLCMPTMSDEEQEALRGSMTRKGFDPLHPILLFGGQILDGRHRYQIALELGLTPIFTEYVDDNPWQLVIEEHNARRNWVSNEQKHLCLKPLVEEAVAFEESRIKAEADKARSEAAKSRERDESGTFKSNGDEGTSGNTNGVTTGSDDELAPKLKKKRKGHQKGQNTKAAATGVNRGAVQRAEKLEKDAIALGETELLDQVKNGECRARKAQEQLNQKKRQIVRTEAAKGIELAANIIIGDFREYFDSIPDNSLSLIFTDPPYDREAEKLLPALAEFAAAKLAPGGSILLYSGVLQIPAVMKAFDGKLRYWWTCACIHSGGNLLMKEYGIRNGWKPIWWFVKDTRNDRQNIVQDTVSGGREKSHHDWQQSLSEAEYWIDELCPADGIVCDPFLGGGTTAVAAAKLGRQWIGFEIDSEQAGIASGRLHDGTPS